MGTLESLKRLQAAFPQGVKAVRPALTEAELQAKEEIRKLEEEERLDNLSAHEHDEEDYK